MSQYFPDWPVAVSTHFLTQRFDVAGIVEATAMSIGVQASKKYNILELYSGLAFNKATLDISYEYDSPEGLISIAYDLEADSAILFTLGSTLNLGPLTLFIDYNMGPMGILTTGLALGF